jgi:small subunit ribosomal protein S6
MYILGASVSDDQLPQVTSQIVKIVEDFGGKNLVENQLGKKKLAYPIKKTRNGFYGLITFDIDTKKVNELDAKIRTQDATIIRYIMINIDEHLARLEKDKVAQAKLSRPQATEDGTEVVAPLVEETVKEEVKKPVAKEEIVAEVATEESEEEKPKAKRGRKPKVEMNEAELDKKIEEALNENLAD